MRTFIKKIKQKARENPRHIVFPEGTEERVLKAVEIIVREKIAYPILIGNPRSIKTKAEKYGIKIDTKKVEIVDHTRSKKHDLYAKKLYELRKNKGLSEKQAYETLKKVNYFGTMMVEMDEADGMVSGATWSTGETIRPALEIIKTVEPFHKVSGFFFMVLEKRMILFADAAVNIDPNSHDLVDIAEDTAFTAKKFGIEPRIAMLSFSTNSSARHPFVDKVKEATKMMKYEHPDIPCDGEMQVDAALVPEICKRKFPGAKICGDANILIFPDLQAANIAYKLVERLAGAIAVGPILQGLKKPINDLSRGCSYRDIVDVTAITTIEAQCQPFHDELTL